MQKEQLEDSHTSEGRKKTFTQIPADQLRGLVERIERLQEEAADIREDIAQIYAEAKGNGYDTKVLRKIIQLRKKDAAEREEEESILDIYLRVLGMKLSLAPIDENPGNEDAA